MVTVQNLKDYLAGATPLTNHQRDLLAHYGYQRIQPTAIRSAAAWEKLGVDSNNVFQLTVGSENLRGHYLLQNECGENMTRLEAKALILKERGEHI